MGDTSLRILAVDWSGRKKKAGEFIWLAEARDDDILRLERGRSQQELIVHLIELARDDPNTVVGLDFAFGMPEWFSHSLGSTTGPDFWGIVEKQGEIWLRDCPWPFWGAKDTKKPGDVKIFRETEEHVRSSLGAQAFSTFQIAGTGAVATGSIRGMPFLRELQLAGWKIWPFDSDGFPKVVEIYPRLLTGAVNKGAWKSRQEYLAKNFPSLDSSTRTLAAGSEDSFDAAVSALVMSQHAKEFLRLPIASDVEQIEGRIWQPAPQVI